MKKFTRYLSNNDTFGTDLSCVYVKDVLKTLAKKGVHVIFDELTFDEVVNITKWHPNYTVYLDPDGNNLQVRYKEGALYVRDRNLEFYDTNNPLPCYQDTEGVFWHAITKKRAPILECVRIQKAASRRWLRLRVPKNLFKMENHLTQTTK